MEVFHGMHCHNLANQSRDRNPRKPFPSLYLPHNLIFAPISPYESHASDHSLDLLGQFSINAHFISHIKPYTTHPQGDRIFSGWNNFPGIAIQGDSVHFMHDSETIEVLYSTCSVLALRIHRKVCIWWFNTNCCIFAFLTWGIVPILFWKQPISMNLEYAWIQ